VTVDVTIGDLQAWDLSRGFLESLVSLSVVDLTPGEALEVLHARRKAGVRTFVARLPDGRVVGTVGLVIEQKFIHRGGRVAYLEDVAVHREFQGHGIGTALVEHAVAEARDAGCYKVILSCFEKLIPFYSRLKFRPHNNGMRLDL
jgi:glucosamine-phosphate N-acetyltransferase